MPSLRSLLTIFFFSFAATLFLPQVVEAEAIIQRDIQRTYELKEKYVQVTETSTVEVTNQDFYVPADSEEVFVVFNPIVDDDEANKKLERTKPTITVTNQNGTALEYSTAEKGQQLLIKVKRETRLNYGETSQITVTYKSYSLSYKNGAVYDFYIPSFAKDFAFETDTTVNNIKTKVLIPQEYGELNVVNPDTEIKTQNDKWLLDFTQEDLTDVIAWVQVGKKQFYKFQINQPYSATTNLPLMFNTYKVLLPRDIQAGSYEQKVYFSELSHEPKQVTTDEHGNLVASFRVPASESGEFKFSGYVTVEETDLNIKQAGNLSDITGEVKAATTAAPYWESDSPEIQNTAEELKGDKTDVYEILQDTYKYVVDRIDYSEVKRFGLNERQGALKTLQGGAAVCMEYSDLFIALMRAQGVPARAAFGYGYDPRRSEDLDTAHQWAEVYLPQQDSWIMVDTTWGESGSQIIGGDLNHFYKHVASESPNRPSPVQVAYFGKKPQIPQEEFSIQATADMNKENMTTQKQLLTNNPQLSGMEETLDNLSYVWSLLINHPDFPILAVGIVGGVALFILLWQLFKYLFRAIRGRSKPKLKNAAEMEA